MTNRDRLPSFSLSIVYSFPPWHYVVLVHSSNDRSNLCPSFSNTTFQNSPDIFDLPSKMSKFQHDMNYASNVALSIHHLPKNPAGAQECKDFKNKGSWVFLKTPADVLSNSIAISSSSSHRWTNSCNTFPDIRNCHFTGHVNCSMSAAYTLTNTLLSDDLHFSVVTTCHHQAVPTDKMLQFLCVLH